MADTKRIVRSTISVLLVIATGLGLYNVFSDNAEVRKQAETLACGSPGCSGRLTREARNPIAQSFEFQVEKSTTPATVECRLAFFLVGDWQCERTGGPPAATSASGAPSARAPR